MPHDTPDTDYVLTSEAGRILGISAQAVKEWERRGILPATRTSSGVRLFARADLLKLRRKLDEQRHRPSVDVA